MKIIFILISALILSNSTVLAKTYYAVKFPVGINTSEKKMAYAYRGMEQLRLLHNQKGQDFINGKITKAEWNAWIKNVFKEKQNAFLEVIHNQKTLMKKSTTYSVDLVNDLEKRISTIN